MEICEASTLRLKVLNKLTHIRYNEMENVIQKKNVYIDKGFKHYARYAHTHTHTHTHTVQTDKSEGQCGLTEIF